MPDAMNAKIFVDTNILFYAIDQDAGDKHERAREEVRRLWEMESGVLSTQVISEFSVNLRKKKALDWASIRKIVEPYLSWRVVTPEARDPLEAMRIAELHKVSFWDASIVYSAVKANVGLIFTEDLNAGQVIEGVRIVNPLR